MKSRYPDIVLSKEKLSNGEKIFVANCISLGIASQGKTKIEAITNIKEAASLYLREMNS